MTPILRRFVADQHGSTAIEYGLMAALIAAFILSAVTGLGQETNAMWGRVDTALSTAANK